MQVTVIYTGNGDPLVHKAGCSDIQRDIKRTGSHGTETFEAATAEDVAATVYADQIRESGSAPDDYVYDLHFKLCAQAVS